MLLLRLFVLFFFFNDTATTEIYTLSLHDALPISRVGPACGVDIVNHSARTYRRLAPAHVPPNGSDGREVAAQRLAWWSERWPLLNLRPSDAAVQRAIDVVDSVVDAAAALVPPRDEHRSAVIRASGELNVAHEAAALDSNPRGPGDSIIGAHHENVLAGPEPIP